MPRIRMTDRMNNASKMSAINTEDYKELFLDVDKLHPSKDNFYPIVEIEQLADNMLLVGHLEPILVGRVDGEDRIISGHRRFYAVKYNAERGHKRFEKVRCLAKEMSHTMFMLTLISGNAFNRKMDDRTLVIQEAEFKKWLIRAKESGEVSIDGKMRDYIAEAFGTSATKIAQVEKINSSLIDEGKEAFSVGKMNFSKAYETAKLSPDKQKLVIEDDTLLSNDVRKLAQDVRIETRMDESGDDEPENNSEISCSLENEDILDNKEEQVLSDFDCIKFLNTQYQSWGIWFQEERIGATYYRYVTEDGFTFYAVEYKKNTSQKKYPTKNPVFFHFSEPGEPFDGIGYRAREQYAIDMVRHHIQLDRKWEEEF